MADFGSWIVVTWDIDATATGEFSGYDPDKNSGLIDLKGTYQWATVISPAKVSATLTVYAPAEDGTAPKTNVPIAVYYRQSSDNATAAQSMTATGTTNIFTFYLGGLRYIRLYSSENQTSDVTFYVRGVRS